MHRNIRLVISFGIICVSGLVTTLLPLPAAAGTNSWTAIGPSDVDNYYGGPFAVDPSSPSTIYLVVNSSIVMKTTDGGGHWTNLAAFDAYPINSLVVDSASPATIYAAGGSPWDYGDFPFYKSIDGGAHWTAVADQIYATFVVAIAPSLTSTLYAGQGGTVSKSIDGGMSWVTFSSGLTGFYVSALAVDPTNADTAYVAQQTPAPHGGPDTGTIFKTTNFAGQLWRQVPISVPVGAVITSLAIDPATPSIIYAAYAYGNPRKGGVFKSVDSGETWSPAQSGLSDTNGVVALVIDPSAPARIYAATTQGVFRSLDAAASWTPINSGLTNLDVWAISVDLTGSILRTASSAGLFEYQVSEAPPPPTGVPALSNYQGMWAVPKLAEAGWGIYFAHQGDVLFASWFTYDANGKPFWVSMTATQQGDGSFTGPIDQTSGPPFSALPYDPTLVTHSTVGTGRVTFTDANNGTFSYTLNGVSQVKALARFVFSAPVPVCTFNSALAAAQAVNFTDMWAVPNLAEPGWGINFTHQGDVIFASWFIYDTNGAPFWVSAALTKTVTGSYAGALDATTGPPFSSVPFDSLQVTHSNVGTATVRFADGNNATLDYTLNGVSRTKALTRFVFRAPGTVCQ